MSWQSRIIEAAFAEAPHVFGRVARSYDLSIVSQAGPNKRAVDEPIIEAALFESGRSVIIVSYVRKTALALDRVMVCWDGSRNAARAVSDAMPLLAKAKNVDVVTITGEKGEDGEIAVADVAEHLARYNVKVELRGVRLEHIDTASSLLSLAADTSADLMVMGGYGHSRLREFVLGGATRGVLSSMTIPTLMSH